MKIVKRIFLVLISLILLLGLGILIFLLTFDLNHYKSFVIQQASNALHRPVEIQSLSTKLSLIPTIKVEGVKILKDTESKEVLLSVPELEATIEILPLLQKQISVQKIVVASADLTWTPDKKEVQKTENDKKSADKNEIAEPQKEADKRNNDKKEKVTQTDLSQKILIETIIINALNCKIGSEKPYVFSLNKFSLNNLSRFSFDFVYDKKTIHVNGNFGSILELATKKENLPVELTLRQRKNLLKINGQIADLINLKKMQFQVVANIPNTASFLKSWNIKNSKIPALSTNFKTVFSGDLEKAEITNTSFSLGKSDLVLSAKGTAQDLRKNPKVILDTSLDLTGKKLTELWGIKPFELKGKITITKTKMEATDLKLNASKSDVSGKLAIDWAKTPLSISGNLNSAYFDLENILNSQKTNTPASQDKKADSKVTQKQPQETAKKENSFVLNTDKLPLDLLKKFDTDLKIQISHLKFSDEINDYANLGTNVKIKSGKLSFPTQIKILGGSIQNQLDVNANDKKVILKTKANGLKPNKVKSLGKNIQESIINLDISLSSSGDSLHTLASNANGNVIIELSGGKIINQEFSKLLTGLNIFKQVTSSVARTTTDQRADILCGAVNIPIKNGVINSDNQIALETDLVNFIVNGQVNLKNETIDLKMVPSVSQTRGMANQLLATAQSVHLTGPWKNVQSKVDATDTEKVMTGLAGIAAQKLAGEKNKSNVITRGSLCQKALGKSITIPKANAQNTTASPKEVNKITVSNKKQNLKQQLVQSLSQALTNQISQK